MIKITDEEFNLFAKYIKDHSGINLKPEKKTLLIGRLTGLMNELEAVDFMAFYKLLQKDADGKILSKLIDKITTNHTYFMREAEHFKYLQLEVFPFLEKSVSHKDLRIWCAASSSGEEPYTLAMLLEDYFGKQVPSWEKKLLATDISVDILKTATNGYYSKEKVNSIPKLWVLNYFNKIDNTQYQVKEKIRNQVIFRRFNLLERVFPFKKKFHVIFCRNVMIYFDAPTKDALIEKFYNHLEYGGYLFIGHSESIDRSKTRFEYIRPAVYRKM